MLSSGRGKMVANVTLVLTSAIYDENGKYRVIVFTGTPLKS